MNQPNEQVRTVVAPTMSAKAVAPGRLEDGWKLGFESLEREIVPAMEMPVVGALPSELEGVLHRIGPARSEVYGERNGHWFDGDGMVHAIKLTGGRAYYQNRFVATEGKAREDRAKRRLYGGFGTRSPGSMWQRFVRRDERKNPANTNVVRFAGKLFALCEGGRPMQLDPDTLATLGEDDLGFVLAPNDLYSAHPKVCPVKGELWNFGVSFAKEMHLHLYATATNGLTRKVMEIAAPFLAMVHDFALTPTKVIFVVAPIVLPTIPVGLMLGQRSFGESLRYAPEKGTRVAVVDRATGDVQWHTCDPFMMFHTVNAWDDGDETVVDVCAYPDGRIMQSLVDVMSGTVPSRTEAWVERLRIGTKGIAKRRLVDAAPMEFPRVAASVESRPYRFAYGVTWPSDSAFMKTPIAVDLETGRVERAPMTDGEFAGELVPVAKRGARSERDVWLLSLVLAAAQRRTDLRVFDGADLTAPPVARVLLPHVVPFGFHGNWTASMS